MAAKTYLGGGGVAGAAGKWSESAAWSPAGVPGLTSDVKFNASSGNCEIAAAAKCRGVDCTGYTGTLTHKVGAALSIGTTTAPEGGIGLKMVAAMTYSGGTEAEILFVATSAAGVQKVFCGGKILGIMAVEKGGSVKLEDEHKAAKVQLLEGTLDTNGQTCEWDFTCTGEAVRVLKLGASLIKLNGKTSVWNVSGLNFTLEAGTAVIEILDSAGSTKSFAGGGKTYRDLILAGESNVSGNVVLITGSNTFHKLALNCPNTAPNSGVQLEGEETQTIEELTTTAKSGKPCKLKGGPKGTTVGKLSKASGNVSVDWLEITNVETDNTVSWYAGANSTLTGATSFWKKEAPGETKIVTALVHGAGASTTTAFKVATPTAVVDGAGLATAATRKVAVAAASVTGAGLATVKASKTASATALVRGAGNATVTLTGELKIVTALIHGAGAAKATTAKIGLATASVTVAGRASSSTTGVGLATAAVHGAGSATVATRKIALVLPRATGGGLGSVRVSRLVSTTGLVHGAGRVTVTTATGVAVVAQAVPTRAFITPTASLAAVITLRSQAAVLAPQATQAGIATPRTQGAITTTSTRAVL